LNNFTLGELESLKITVLMENTVTSGALLGAHGLSFLVEAKKNGKTIHILVDVGRDPEVLLNNMEVLKVDISKIDLVVLTHCHHDHTHGLATIISEIGKKDLPVIAHPSIFRFNFRTRPFLSYIGIRKEDAKDQIERCGGRLFLVSEPFELMEGLITSGEISRETEFENLDRSRYTLENGHIQPYMVTEELAVIANVSGKGLVIITGCSHAGIINICKQAVSITGLERIEGILGGLHLLKSSPEIIGKTIQTLKQYNPAWISSGHCTGFLAEVALKNAFQEQYHKMTCGSIYNV
jgi:7,8-dihydropterin-6-yl-methyl-4-(beta-D-ribofuranosyl)aminobenzene 5'-phosphate synthase